MDAKRKLLLETAYRRFTHFGFSRWEIKFFTFDPRDLEEVEAPEAPQESAEDDCGDDEG